MAFTAFLDTCVLVPSALRDVLLELATHRAYRALWSTDVEVELERVITRLYKERKKDPLETLAYIRRLRNNMNTALPDAQVSGYEWMVDAVTGIPDPDDRHIVAAASQGQASVIVTFNTKDFPSSSLPDALFSQDPDDFLLDLLDLWPNLVVGALNTIVARTGRHGPRWSIDDLLVRLEKESVSQFCGAFREVTGSGDERLSGL